MDYNNIEVSLFKSKSDKSPTRVKLLDILHTDQYKDIVEAIRNEPDKGKRDKLKSNLPAFTPSAICEGGHGMQHFVSHSGLLFFDFDFKDNEAAPNFDDLPKLAEAIPYILYLGRSVSGKGFHALIPIADINKDNHKAYYTTIYEEFVKCSLIPDKAASDISRLCYVSYDPKAYINLEAQPLELEEVMEGQEESFGGTLEPDQSITDLYGTYIEAAMLIERAKSRKAERVKELAENPKKEEPEEAEAANPKPEGEKKKDILEIADEYNEWRNNVANGFALSFGAEMGRPLFHAFSRLSDKYDPSDTDKEFDKACRYTLAKLNSGERDRLVKVNSFFKLCQQYGLMPTKLERDFGNLDLSTFSQEEDNNLSADDEDL